MHRRFGGLHEYFRLGAGNDLAIRRRGLVGMGGDDDTRFDQGIDRRGRLPGAGGIHVANIHDGQLRLVIIVHDGFLIGNNAGVS